MGRPGVVLATGTPAGVSGLGGIFCVIFSSRHVPTLFWNVAFTDWSFGYCRPRDSVSRDHGNLRFPNDLVCGRTGRLRRTVRKPLRSDRFLHSDRAACHLSATAGKSANPFECETLSRSDGAYLRRGRRGIAAVPHRNHLPRFRPERESTLNPTRLPVGSSTTSPQPRYLSDNTIVAVDSVEEVLFENQR